jgi:hypothetical protein
VFRNVTLNLQGGARLQAENSVFINCKFRPSSDVAMMMGHSRWSFSGCILYRSSFSTLSALTVSLQLENSACVESTFPQRTVYTDSAGAFRNRANEVSNTLFLRSRVTPSMVWMTDQCNFVRCPVTQEDSYDSKTAMSVALFVPEGDPMAAQLRSRTLVCDKGDLWYGILRKPSEVAVPPGLWALLPVENSDLSKLKEAEKEPETKPAS